VAFDNDNDAGAHVVATFIRLRILDDALSFPFYFLFSFFHSSDEVDKGWRGEEDGGEEECSFVRGRKERLSRRRAREMMMI